MTYTATVRAGFDMSETDVDVTDDTIKIVIPRTTIQEITIDPDSLEFYDTSFSIITMNKEAVKEALQEAEGDAEKKAASSELLEAADENAMNDFGTAAQTVRSSGSTSFLSNYVIFWNSLPQ